MAHKLRAVIECAEREVDSASFNDLPSLQERLERASWLLATAIDMVVALGDRLDHELFPGAGAGDSAQ